MRAESFRAGSAALEKDLLDFQPEQSRQRECQRQAGIVLAGLDRITDCREM